MRNLVSFASSAHTLSPSHNTGDGALNLLGGRSQRRRQQARCQGKNPDGDGPHRKGVTAAQRLPPVSGKLRLARCLLLPLRAKGGHVMESIYYKLVGLILLVPWLLLFVTVAGYLRGRLARRAV